MSNGRQRVADDFDAIRQRMEELTGARTDNCTTEQELQPQFYPADSDGYVYTKALPDCHWKHKYKGNGKIACQLNVRFQCYKAGQCVQQDFCLTRGS